MSSFIADISGCKSIMITTIQPDRMILQTLVPVTLDNGECGQDMLEAELPLNGEQVVFIRSKIHMLSGRQVPEAWDKSNFEKAIRRRVRQWNRQQQQVAILKSDVKSIDWDEVDKSIAQDIEMLNQMADSAGQPRVEVATEYQRRFTIQLCQQQTNHQKTQ